MTRVLFRVDASPRMGGGHVMRCLTLAQALLDEGCEVTFVSRASASPFATAFAWLQLPLALPDEDITPGWELVPWSSSVQRDDAIATRALAGDSYDWVVVDHYRLGAPWERELPGRKLVIDDLANRPHECNLLLDQNADRDPALYASLLPADCTILTGSRYALLRPEFSAARARALARRGGGIERILISLGAADTGNLTLPAVMLVGQICPRAAIDVVIGGTAERLAEVEALASGRVTVHVDTGAMADLMCRADLALGAAGTSSWERCCLGLPAITLVTAENQRVIAEPLTARGAAIVVHDLAEAGSVLAALTATRCAEIARAAAQVTDGTGAPCMVRKILALGVRSGA